jgi:two-component system cell cycle response regulator DivK
MNQIVAVEQETLEKLADSGNGTGRRPRVLVIEDNVDMREFLARVLDRQGYDFLEAGDGEEGLAIARAQQPDLILMDISLPALDGFEVTRQLKQDAAMGHIPIVAVTAHARPADEQRALEAGCDGYLSKPYSLRDFVALIEKHIKQPS